LGLRVTCSPVVFNLARCTCPKEAAASATLGIRVWELGFRVQGLGFRLQGLMFRV